MREIEDSVLKEVEVGNVKYKHQIADCVPYKKELEALICKKRMILTK